MGYAQARPRITGLRIAMNSMAAVQVAQARCRDGIAAY
jgi:hypothetical protein